MCFVCNLKKVSGEELKQQNFASLCILHIAVLSLYTDQTISLQYCNIIGSDSSLSIGQFQRQKIPWLMRIMCFQVDITAVLSLYPNY